jgi:hypothetical protein
LANSLTRWQENDSLSARHLNEPVDRLNKIGEITGGNGIGVTFNMGGTLVENLKTDIIRRNDWLGIIVCCGDCDQKECCQDEADEEEQGDCDCECGNEDGECKECCDKPFKDNRYWVVKADVLNGLSGYNSGFCAHLDIDYKELCDPKYNKVPATNLTENNCGTHLLRPGTWVHITEWDDYGDRKRYTFSQHPSPKEDVVDCGDRECAQPSSSSSASSSSSSSSSSSGSSSHSGSFSMQSSSSSSDSSNSSNSNSNSNSNSGSNKGGSGSSSSDSNSNSNSGSGSHGSNPPPPPGSYDGSGSHGNPSNPSNNPSQGSGGSHGSGNCNWDCFEEIEIPTEWEIVQEDGVCKVVGTHFEKVLRKKAG